MAQIFLNPSRPVFSANGIEAGAKLYFYLSGSLTETPSYTDAALTVEHPHPVVANAAGVFPNIYIDDENVDYRAYCTTSDGVVLFDIDPYDNLSTPLDLGGLTNPGADRIVFWDFSAGGVGYLEAGDGLTIAGTVLSADAAYTAGDGIDISSGEISINITEVKPTETITFALSDLTSDLTTGANKAYWDAPFALTILTVGAAALEAPTGAALQFGINEGGVSILSTDLTIDAGETNSATAATPAVISDAAIAANARVSFDIDQIGSTNAGKGAQITLTYRRT